MLFMQKLATAATAVLVAGHLAVADNINVARAAVVARENAVRELALNGRGVVGRQLSNSTNATTSTAIIPSQSAVPTSIRTTTSPSPTTTSSALSPGSQISANGNTWQLLGCFGSTDGFAGFSLAFSNTAGNLTVQTCLTTCGLEIDVFAGIGPQGCYCSKSVSANTQMVSSALCTLPSISRKRQIAGTISIFQVVAGPLLTTPGATSPGTVPAPIPAPGTVVNFVATFVYVNITINVNAGGASTVYGLATSTYTSSITYTHCGCTTSPAPTIPVTTITTSVPGLGTQTLTLPVTTATAGATVTAGSGSSPVTGTGTSAGAGAAAGSGASAGAAGSGSSASAGASAGSGTSAGVAGSGSSTSPTYTGTATIREVNAAGALVVLFAALVAL